jgi:hypothetical protein
MALLEKVQHRFTTCSAICTALLKKINGKKRYRFKKATLYEREVIRKQKFFFAGRSFHTHTTGG